MANELLPMWKETGVEPPQSLKDGGWQPGMKPSAQHMNWLFNRIYKCLEEIQAGGGTAELEQELADLQAVVATHMADYLSHTGYAVATGTANNYIATLIPALSSYKEGVSLRLKINVANTGASTINVNGLGAKSIKKSNGNVIAAGNLKAGSIYTLAYDGTSFILQGEGGEYGTATANDVLQGKTLGTENGIVNGNIVNQPGTLDAPNHYSAGDGVLNHFIPYGAYLTDSGSGSNSPNARLYDVDFVPSNIRKGINIFGVDGTLDIASLGGRKYATGTATSTSSSLNFQLVSGQATMPYVEVSGLTFKPSLILIRTIGTTSSYCLVTYDELGALYPKLAVTTSVSAASSNPLSRAVKADVSPAYVNASGFLLPVILASQNVGWIAVE